MKSKREVLEHIVQRIGCYDLDCRECPYKDLCNSKIIPLFTRLSKIGAIAVLRQNRRKRKFDPNKILTCDDTTALVTQIGAIRR